MPLLAMAVFAPVPAFAAGIAATVYKDPDCDCCQDYARYLEQNGFAVTVTATREMSAVHEQFGVPHGLEGCHATAVGGYVVEGHVPVAAIRKLLAERPAIRGIALPGMPEGSPGMTGRKLAPFQIYAITERGSLPFMEE
ncbi:MAG: CopG family transcriptional regulator [Alphaproteobacteria bacterium]|nr:CopG family transcriptional regulator [Alphaproteobacteria bacterium]